MLALVTQLVGLERLLDDIEKLNECLLQVRRRRPMRENS